MSDVPAADAAPVSRDRARLAVAAVAIGVRAIAAFTLATTPVGLHDPLLYQRFAQGIAKGDGYLSFNGELTSYYPPGYPFFLGAVQWICDRLSVPDRLPLVAALAQSLLGGLAVWAVVGVGDRIAATGAGAPARARVGLAAGLVVALWPNLVLHSTVLLSETLFVAVFCCFLLAMVRALDTGRSVHLLGAGALLGAAALVRPQVVLVGAAVVAAVLVARRSWPSRVATVVIPVVGLVLVVAPWTIRNAGVFDEFVAVSTNGGDNLCVGFHPGATGHFAIPEFCDTGEFYIDGPAAEARRNAETSARATDWATSNLGALPALSLRKLWYTYEHDHDALRAVESYEEDRFLPGAVRTMLSWLSDGAYAVIMAAAVAGAVLATRRWWAARRDRSTNTMLLVFLLVATAASALVPVLFFGETRFKVPATPCFALLAGIAIVAAFDRRATTTVTEEPA